MILPPNRSIPSAPFAPQKKQPIPPPRDPKQIAENKRILESLPFYTMSPEEITLSAEMTQLDEELSNEVEFLLAQKEAQIESHLKGLENSHKEKQVVKTVFDAHQTLEEYAPGANEAILTARTFLEKNVIPANLLISGAALQELLVHSEKIKKLSGNFLFALDKGSLGTALIFKGKILRETKQALALLKKEYEQRIDELNVQLKKLSPEERKAYRKEKLAEFKAIKTAIEDLKKSLKKETRQWKKDDKKFSESTMHSGLHLMSHASSILETAFIYTKFISETFSLGSGTFGFLTAFSALNSDLKNHSRFQNWVDKYRTWSQKNEAGGEIVSLPEGTLLTNKIFSLKSNYLRKRKELLERKQGTKIKIPLLNPAITNRKVSDLQLKEYRKMFKEEFSVLPNTSHELREKLEKYGYEMKVGLGQFKIKLQENGGLRKELFQKFVLYHENLKAKDTHSASTQEIIEMAETTDNITEIKEKLREFGYELTTEMTRQQFLDLFKAVDQSKIDVNLIKLRKTILSYHSAYQEALKAFDQVIKNAQNLYEKRKAITEKKAFLLAPQIDSLLPKIKELKRKQFANLVVAAIQRNEFEALEKAGIHLDNTILNGKEIDKTKLYKQLSQIVETRVKTDKNIDDFRDTMKLIEDELQRLDPPLRMKIKMDGFSHIQVMDFLQVNLLNTPEKLKTRGLIKEIQDWKTPEEKLDFSQELNKNFESWFAAQNPQMEKDPIQKDKKTKSLLTTYIDHQETIEQTTKNALSKMVQKKQDLDSSLIKLKLVESSTFFALSTIMLSISTALWMLGIATLPFSGIGALVLSLSLTSWILTAGFYMAAVYLHSRRNPELTKEYRKGISVNLLYTTMGNMFYEYRNISKQKKLLKTAAIVKAIRSKVGITKNDPVYDKAYKNYLQAKKEFEAGLQKVDNWHARLETLKSRLSTAAWKDYATHANLKISTSENHFDTLEALNKALKEVDLNLMSPETKELLEVHLGLDLKQLQEKLAPSAKEIRNALQKFFIMDEAEYIKFMKQQELRLDTKLIKAT